MARKVTAEKGKKRPAARTVRDTLGELTVPADAYYGAQTKRASENFAVSGIMPKPVFIRATAMVKYAAAETNTGLGLLGKRRGRAVMKAAGEIIDGALHDQFIVDVYQAGAGTSHNMNANEVIASRAAELMGGERGDLSLVHPNDHVNMAQSTNDTFPAAMRVAALLSAPELITSLRSLERALSSRGRAFKNIIKSGRTHLQDAVPIMLGSEFFSYAASVKRARERLELSLREMREIGLGATAAGTGLNSHPSFRRDVVRALGRVSGLKGLKSAPDLFEALSSMGSFVALSGSLKEAAIELVRIANDLRLLSSGPATGFAEIRLPAVQPGSSIMPGKVNPVMAEMLDMVAFQVIGNDLAVTMAAQAGQLELNVMGPVVNYNILHSMEILSRGVRGFTERCVKGIKADKERCRRYFEASGGLATVLNRFIGYEQAAALFKEAEREGKTVIEAIRARGILSDEELSVLFDPVRVTGPDGT